MYIQTLDPYARFMRIQVLPPNDKFMQLQMQSSNNEIITYFYKRIEGHWVVFSPRSSIMRKVIQIFISDTNEHIYLWDNEKAKFYKDEYDPELFTSLLQQ